MKAEGPRPGNVFLVCPLSKWVAVISGVPRIVTKRGQWLLGKPSLNFLCGDGST
jgi:hypothetical protein